MASCHVRLASLRSVEVSTTSCASYGRLSGHCLKMRVKHWSRRSSPVTWTTATPCSSACQKDWCTAVAVGSERRRPSGDWYSTFINAGALSATLATGTPERRLQGWDACSSVAVWHFAILPTERPPSCRRCSLAMTTFHNCRTCVVTWIHTVPSAIEDLQLLDLDYRTIFHHRRKRQTCRTIDFGGCY